MSPRVKHLFIILSYIVLIAIIIYMFYSISYLELEKEYLNHKYRPTLFNHMYDGVSRTWIGFTVLSDYLREYIRANQSANLTIKQYYTRIVIDAVGKSIDKITDWSYLASSSSRALGYHKLSMLFRNLAKLAQLLKLVIAPNVKNGLDKLANNTYIFEAISYRLDIIRSELARRINATDYSLDEESISSIIDSINSYVEELKENLGIKAYLSMGTP